MQDKGIISDDDKSLGNAFVRTMTVKESKAIPLQAWTGPEGSRRFPDFKTIGT